MKGKFLWAVVCVAVICTAVLSFTYIKYGAPKKNTQPPSINDNPVQRDDDSSWKTYKIPDSFTANVNVKCRYGDFCGTVERTDGKMIIELTTPVQLKGSTLEMDKDSIKLTYLGVKVKEVNIPDKYRDLANSFFNPLDNMSLQSDNIQEQEDSVKISYRISGRKVYCVFDKNSHDPLEISCDGLGSVSITNLKIS